MIRQRFPLILICLTFLVLFPFVTHSQIHISGEISGTLVDTTYIVDDDINVTGRLDIEPGARLRFEQGTHFTVNSLLVADGEPGDSIYFELNDDATFWHGIDVASYSSYGHIFDHCVIAGSNSSGMFVGEVNSLSVSNCHFRNNSASEYGGGLRWLSYWGSIDSCTFTENTNYALFVSGVMDDTDFTNLTIVSNEGGLRVVASHAHFKYCNISYNSITGRGGGVYNQESGTSFERCVIANNEASQDGGGVFSLVRITIINCNLINNSSVNDGSALYAFGPFDLMNSIVFNNHRTIAIYTSLGFIDDRTIINNNCFYSNSFNNYPYAPDHNNLGVIDSLNINEDPCDPYGNIYIDPQLSDSLFRLSDSSPCIDAGYPNSSLDPDSTIADIGAYYFDQTFVDEHGDFEQPISFVVSAAYPNPFNATTSVLVETPFRSSLTIRVFDILGRLVYSRDDNTVAVGQHLYQINADGWTSGVYFLNVRCGKKQDTQRVIFIK